MTATACSSEYMNIKYQTIFINPIQRWTMFRAFGILQYVPGGQRRMGEHVTVSSGANLKMVIVEPINITHTVIN